MVTQVNIAVSEPGLGRFRVSIFKQRGELVLVVRSLTAEIPPYQTLGLPPLLAKLILSQRGLILFVGEAGSGKSTSLTSLLDYRNANSRSDILTIEEPIESLHPHKRSLVNQREVGADTGSYEDALRSAAGCRETRSSLVTTVTINGGSRPGTAISDLAAPMKPARSTIIRELPNGQTGAILACMRIGEFE